MKILSLLLCLLTGAVYAQPEPEHVVTGKIICKEGISPVTMITISTFVNEMGSGTSHNAPVNKDGTFSMRLPGWEQMAMLDFMDRPSESIYLLPGSRLHMQITLYRDSSQYLFSGTGSQLNNEWMAYKDAFRIYLVKTYGGNNLIHRFNVLQAVGDNQAVLKELPKRYARESMFLDTYLQEHKVSPKLASLLRTELLYEYGFSLIRFGYFKNAVNNDSIYADFEKRFPADNPAALASIQYHNTFMDSYLRTYERYVMPGRYMDHNPFLQQLLTDTTKLSADELSHIRRLYPVKDLRALPQADRQFLVTLFSMHAEEQMAFLVHHNPLLPAIDKAFKGHTRDLALSYFLKDAYDVANEMPEVRPVFDSVLVFFHKTAQPGVFKDYVLKEMRPEDTVVFNKTLADLTVKYRGKTVYVDFWGTWCTPCKEAMPYSVALHKKLNNPDIVFLYLCSMSPEKDWLTLKDKLAPDGEHILLDAEMKAKINDVLGVKAYPAYMIMDGKGRIVELKAPGPESEKTETLLRSITK